MINPRVLILRAPGTNCDLETAHAFELAGAHAERRHVNRLLESPKELAEYQVLCIPGGFSYGDDIAAGRILGNQIEHHLAEALHAFHESGKLILGICNGFQVLLKTRLLAPVGEEGPGATLTSNDSGKFEARWVRLRVDAGNCVFLKGLQQFELPIAHAEGKFVTRDEKVLDALDEAGRLVLRYEATAPSNSSSDLIPYPDNPNGSIRNVAGICDDSGRVFGLMPHPERYVDPTQHPQWTRKGQLGLSDGLRIFQNAVRYFE